MKKVSAAALAILVQFSSYTAFANVKSVQPAATSTDAAYTPGQAAKNAQAASVAVQHATTVQELSDNNASAAFAPIQITGTAGAPGLELERQIEQANPSGSVGQFHIGFDDLQLIATVNASGARVFQAFDTNPDSPTFGQKVGQIVDPTGNQDLGTRTGLLSGKYILLSETVDGVTVFHAYHADRTSTEFLQEAFRFADPTPAGNPSDFGGSYITPYSARLLSNNLLVVSDKDAAGRGVLHVFDMRRDSAAFGQCVITVESQSGGSLLGMHSSILIDNLILVETTDGTGPAATKSYQLIFFDANSSGVSATPILRYQNPDAFGSGFGAGRVQYVGFNLLVEAKDVNGRVVFHLFNLFGSLIKTISDTDAPEQAVFGTSGVLVANNYLLVRDTDANGSKVIRAFNLVSQPGQLAFTLQANSISGTFGSAPGGLFQDPANPELLYVTDVMYGVDVRYVYDLRATTTGNRLIGGFLMPAPVAHVTGFPISLGSGLLMIRDKNSSRTYHVLDTKLDSPTFGQLVASFTIPSAAQGFSVSVDEKKSRIKIILTDSLKNVLFASLRIVR